MTANSLPGPAHSDISDAIAACFGASAVDYISNKARGGTSGKKGSEFEQQFTTAKVVELINDQLRSFNGEWPILEEQAFGFVDDLVIRTPAAAHYHQLKNTKSLSWQAGVHPLVTDFTCQVALCRHLKVAPAKTTLVVSSQELCKTMHDTIPSEIAPHSTVEFFPYVGPSMNKLVLEYTPLRQALSQLTPTNRPKDDELEAAFGALMIGTKSAQGPVSVQTIVNTAQRLYAPALRLFPWDVAEFKLEDQFVKVLEKIHGLVYGVERGFFHWEAFGMSGVLQYNCLDAKFTKFQSLVIANSPSHYDELEKLLP
jgi:hypothetical protein